MPHRGRRQSTFTARGSYSRSGRGGSSRASASYRRGGSSIRVSSSRRGGRSYGRVSINLSRRSKRGRGSARGGISFSF